MGLVSLIMGNNSSVKVINKIPMGGIVYWLYGKSIEPKRCADSEDGCKNF